MHILVFSFCVSLTNVFHDNRLKVYTSLKGDVFSFDEIVQHKQPSDCPGLLNELVVGRSKIIPGHKEVANNQILPNIDSWD